MNNFQCSRRHKCKHNPGGSNKSSILPLEDYKGNIIGEVMTKEEKIAFERKHSQVRKGFGDSQFYNS